MKGSLRSEALLVCDSEILAPPAEKKVIAKWFADKVYSGASGAWKCSSNAIEPPELGISWCFR